MDPDRDVKKLRQVVRLHKSFKNQQNDNINLSRSVLRWTGKVYTAVFERISVRFKNGYTIYY